MNNLTEAQLETLRTRPHRTKLWLSVYQPKTIFACRFDDADPSQGQQYLPYDGVTEGAYTAVKYDMMMFVGTTLGGQEKGRIRVRWASSGHIRVAENSIQWADDDYLTIVDFYEVVSKYPRIIQDPADATKTIWYKDYDVAYSNQNEVGGVLICMGSHYAGFAGDDVYYTASGTYHTELGTTGSLYYWFFEGGTPSGSTALTPGNVNYANPGHYTTQLSVSGTNGSYDVSYRHVSIYDRPNEGTNVPILSWELAKIQGSRGAGGYRTTIRIRQEAPLEEIRDGSLVIIFADDWYGDEKVSFGGNQEGRETIVFVGYIVNGSIYYNYADEFMEFEVESPTGIAKMCDAFAVSIEDIDDPSAQAAANPEYYPSAWTLIPGLNMKKALYHYLRWHSTFTKCADVQFLGTDQIFQYADFDRESLYSAVNSLLDSVLQGSIVCDMQGKAWAETDCYLEAGRLTNDLVLSDQDWVGEPVIEEALTNDVAFIEGGGVSYTGFGGTSTPLLSVAPGEAPGYRGKIERRQGLAISSQANLNAIIGKIYSFENRQYPSLRFVSSGNYRVFDIAPQQEFTISIPATKNPRGVAINTGFYVDNMSWIYNPRTEQFNPRMTFSEIPASPITAATSVIPPIPPTEGDSGGFEVPPFTIPPFDIPSISFPDLGFVFIPALGGVTAADVLKNWHDGTLTHTSDPHGVGIVASGDSAAGATIVPNGVTSMEIYPLIYCTSAGGGTANIYVAGKAFYVGSVIADVSDDITANTDLVLGLNWSVNNTITLDNLESGSYIEMYTETITNSGSLVISCAGWVAILSQ